MEKETMKTFVFGDGRMLVNVYTEKGITYGRCHDGTVITVADPSKSLREPDAMNYDE